MSRSKIAFLHTAEVHRGTFDALLAERSVDVDHVVREDWLEHARHHGIDAELHRKVSEHLLAAVATASVVVCTCSTLGPIAQELGLTNVIRIDRPMMEAAARLDGEVVLALCLESTAQASSGLLDQAYAQLGKAPRYTVLSCSDAWPLFESGDTDGFGRHIARLVREQVAGMDECACVVLAQASMAAAERYLSDLGRPVFSSPALAVEEALALAARAHR